MARRAAAADIKFVALGVAAEVVVIVENQNARVWIRLAKEMCGGKTANASSDNDEIVETRIGFLHGTPILSAIARQLMCNLKGADMIAPQPRQSRWIGGSTCTGSLQRKNLVRKGSTGD